VNIWFETGTLARRERILRCGTVGVNEDDLPVVIILSSEQRTPGGTVAEKAYCPPFSTTKAAGFLLSGQRHGQHCPRYMEEKMRFLRASDETVQPLLLLIASVTCPIASTLPRFSAFVQPKCDTPPSKLLRYRKEREGILSAPLEQHVRP